MDWLLNHFTVHEQLPRPNWETIFKHADEKLNHREPNELWTEVARAWMDELIQHLPVGYTTTESNNFILVSNEQDHYNKSMSRFLESCRRGLLSNLAGIANDQGYGKHVVIIFGDIDRYYDYVSYYGPQEGTYGLSAGMYMNYGYGHFVFQHDTLDMAEAVATHEMTHALLNHLPIPAWLNEGLAVNMESIITGHVHPIRNQAMFNKHQRFWNEQNIQEFWRGESFFRADDGGQLSYQLAQILVTNLAENYPSFVEFANKANWQDSGEAAIEDIFDISLGDMIANFLGEGEWWPMPEKWQGQN